jgi:eukaryotic-like serine/threonine-protein kinase
MISTSPKSPHSTQQGGFLGRYPILDHLLDEGSYSLLSSEHPTLNMGVTLKLASLDDFVPQQSEERLLQEAHLLGQLHHPNLAKIYDSGRDQDKHLFVVLEQLPNQTLQEYELRYAPLSLQAVLSLSEQLASLLESIHHEGYVLQTLSPECLSISREKLWLKLFEASNAIPIGSESTLPLFYYDAQHCIAPELKSQIHSQRIATPQSDLFSLGAMICGMLTGEKLFGADPQTEADLQLKRLRALSKEFTAFLLSLLSLDPNKRPASAKSCFTALSGIARDLGLEDMPS